MKFHSIGAFGPELFYGVGDKFVVVIQYVGIVTAILYTVARATEVN